MKKVIISGLAALAIGLTGCSATAEGAPVPAEPATGTPFDISNLLPTTPPTPKTPCVMIVPGQWTCPKVVDAPN